MSPANVYGNFCEEFFCCCGNGYEELFTDEEFSITISNKVQELMRVISHHRSTVVKYNM